MIQENIEKYHQKDHQPCDFGVPFWTHFGDILEPLLAVARFCWRPVFRYLRGVPKGAKMDPKRVPKWCKMTSPPNFPHALFGQLCQQEAWGILAPNFPHAFFGQTIQRVGVGGGFAQYSTPPLLALHQLWITVTDWHSAALLCNLDRYIFIHDLYIYSRKLLQRWVPV